VSPLARNTVKNMAATLRAILYQAQHVDELLAIRLPILAASSTCGTIPEPM
jgi:hypothetical protein